MLYAHGSCPSQAQSGFKGTGAVFQEANVIVHFQELLRRSHLLDEPGPSDSRHIDALQHTAVFGCVWQIFVRIIKNMDIAWMPEWLRG